MKGLKFRLQYSVLLLLILVARLSVFAQITPSQDAYINTATAATNYGTAATLGVVSVGSSIQTTYIQFDLSSIPSSYKSSNVAKATLKLFVNSVSNNGSFNLDLVNGSWNEKTITADLLPALGTTIKGSIPLTTANVNNYITIDLTAVVGEWLTGTQANDGIALVPNSGLSATFQSKENTNQSHPAELDVVFTSGGNGTITGIAAGTGLQGGGTSGTVELSMLKTCSKNQVLQWNGTAWVCATGGPGSVTSVGLTAPSPDFVVSNSPVTSTGTLNFAWNIAPTSDNNGNAIVKRDANGNFAASTVSAVNLNATNVNATSFSGKGAGLTNVNAAQLGGHAASYFANTFNNSFTGTQIFHGNGNSALIGDMGCGSGYVGITMFGAVNCELYSMLGDTAGNLYLNRKLGGTMRFRENNADELTISPGGAITTIGNIAAASFTGDGSTLSNIAALAGLNTFTGFNIFEQNTFLTGNGETAVIGNVNCPGNSAGIAFQPLNGTCVNYALLDFNGQTILNRISGHSMSFREGNGPDQMTIFPGGGVSIVATPGLPDSRDLTPTTLYLENDTNATTDAFFTAFAPNIPGAPTGCIITTDGSLACTGSKSAVVPVADGARMVTLYAVEAPENWFEDYGGGTLVNGTATVALEPLFAQTVNTGTTYRVFVTPKGNCHGLYVTNETSTSFEVHELGSGQANIDFDYRIIAKRKGYENIRMADKTETFKRMREHAGQRAAYAKKP